MGLFCANLHFHTTDDQALLASLNRLGISRYRVLPAQGGWTSLYEERVSQQDDERIRDLAGELSADLNVAAIAFLVHDSDIACYWLYDSGRLLDEYNSCPDYFADDDDGPPRPSGGRPDVLLRYCRTGVRRGDLAAVLSSEPLFAEQVIEQLAEALGIDRQRALADYKDAGGGGGPDGADGPDDAGGGGDDDGDDQEGGPHVIPLRTALAGRLAKMLGSDPRSATADPRATALVQAAANDDLDEIGRLLAEGVPIDAEAPSPLPGGQQLAGLGQLLPGGTPQIAMTPLLAATVNKQRRAIARLLDDGADLNRVHPLFGTAVHAATGAGDLELLQLLIDHGADVRARNAQGQTPLEAVATARATGDRLAQAQAMMRSIGIKLPGFLDQMANVTLPTVGWDACEQLLRAQLGQ